MFNSNPSKTKPKTTMETKLLLKRLRIVIAGGTGHIGQLLAAHFHAQGHEVIVIARHAQTAAWPVIIWDGQNLADWMHTVDSADVVINLAGRSVNCRYTDKNRREIKESRVRSTQAIGLAIAQASQPPGLWINASTATIYRHALDRPMDEATGELGGGEPGAPSTWRFSIDVATSWEQAFFSASTPATRKIALRSAMVMNPDRGGIFDTLRGLVIGRLGGQAGSGRQFVSWIHELDFVNAVDFLIARPDLTGRINVCSPNPLPNRDFMAALRRACGVRRSLPATKWMLELGAIFLRTETELILKSRRVVPGRLLEAGFKFRYPDWPEAAQDLMRRRRTAKAQ
jgi:uncharacterized protein (TIGR01777 family)